MTGQSEGKKTPGGPLTLEQTLVLRQCTKVREKIKGMETQRHKKIQELGDQKRAIKLTH